MRKNPSQNLRKILSLFSMSSDFVTPQAAVLAKGIEFSSSPLTPKELQLVSLIASHTMMVFGDFAPKECFSNAQKFLYVAQGLDSSQNIQYIEGFFAFSDMPFPIHHGWISFNDKLIDLTLTQEVYNSGIQDLEDRVVGEIPSTFEYLGIPIDTSDIVTKIEKNNETHMILDDWRPEFRKLRDKYLK